MPKSKSMTLKVIKINNKTTIDEKDLVNLGEILGERVNRSSSSSSLLFTIFRLFGRSS
jgi:hypothetical protein